MTDKEFRELDAEVAVRIMGWSRRDADLALECAEGSIAACQECERGCIPEYSTDPAVALTALETWPGDFEVRRRNGIAWQCVLFKPSREWEAWESSLPLAVCRALLKAHTGGTDVSKPDAAGRFRYRCKVCTRLVLFTTREMRKAPLCQCGWARWKLWPAVVLDRDRKEGK